MMKEMRMSTVPTVSIIIPAYNTAAFIGNTLASVVAQVYTDYEIIVVNDASPDTREMEPALAQSRDRILYIVLEQNRGLAGARNAGIRAARGQSDYLLDSDDEWEPTNLRASGDHGIRSVARSRVPQRADHRGSSACGTHFHGRLSVRW